MARKSWTYSVIRANLQVFGVVSFLLLHTAAVEGRDVVANIGQRVELHCTFKANSNVNEIVWFKNDKIWFKFGFQDDYEVVLYKSLARLVIPSVKEDHAGLYQCASQLTNLTVLNCSQAASTESSDSKHSDLMQTILNSSFVDRVIFVITSFIGVGIIVASYNFRKWWMGKFSPCHTNTGLHVGGGSLSSEFQQLVDEVGAARYEIKRVRGEIIAKMVELNCRMESTDKAHNDQLANELKVMKAVYIKQSEDLETLWGNVVSKINKLEEKVSNYHGIVVNELKQQSTIVKRQDKAIKEIQEILQSWPSYKHSTSVTDAYIDG